jgi:hypothetical protein
MRCSAEGCRERAAQDVSGQGRRSGGHRQLIRMRNMSTIVPHPAHRSQATALLDAGARPSPAIRAAVPGFTAPGSGAGRARRAEGCEHGRMTSLPGGERPTGRLRLAIVLSSTEDECTVFADERQSVVTYAQPFPRPRAERVTPGSLVAIADGPDGSAVVIWRWFDAVVVDRTGQAITLWEPGHGSVLAQPRDPQRVYRPGSRAYLSAGLPGADWWVAGPAAGPAEHSDVDLDAVEDFFTSHGLWNRLT